MAGRHRKGCLVSLARLALGGGLCVFLAACEPKQGESHPEPRITVTVREGVRRGDQCNENGAIGKTNTGQLMVCARHRGLNYDTWDVL